ncbi:ribonuclease E/G [Halobacillus sp. Marseille-P3879]|uniref:ribonuclease E/G n=1 Tax=Halobacillus sp. Marseille-P3879 TaxID=2045014 RepID=UPI000C7A060A|nr:ribonuclease E/G [Halobacillus sp. Marseille-P3879]
MRTIALHTQTPEKIGLVMNHSRLIEYTAARPEAALLSGSIYKGKVQSIHKGMQAAFVDIGEQKHAFLKKELIPWCSTSIEQSITEGREVIVQVTKEPAGNKGAQVTADPAVPGLYIIYQPFGNNVAISRKIEKNKGFKLKSEIEAVLKGCEGAILRTNAAGVEISQVVEELERLRRNWNSLKIPKKPGIIWEDDVILNQFIRTYGGSSDEILVDDVEVSQLIKCRFPSLAGRVQWRNNLEHDIGHTINELQDKLVQRTVTTAKGVQLIIDPTEAMIVIDVNSHRYAGRSLSNTEALKVNQHAATEIARLIRLRNYSGMILIDFISMRNPSHKEQLLSFLKKETANDPVVTKVHGITKLGIVELTRTRRLPSVNEQLLSSPGITYNIDTQSYRLERYLRNNSHVEAVLLRVSSELYDRKKQLRLEPISSKIPQELFVKRDDYITGWQIELEGSLDIVKEAAELRGHAVDNLF